MEETAGVRFRPLGRGAFLGGFLMTALIHAVLAGLVYYSQRREPPRPEAARDLMVTKMVKLGKEREKFWLPRIVEPPPPQAPEPTIKVTENLEAAPVVKEAPKPEDKTISKDLKRALDRARSLAKNAVEEPPEGSTSGSATGTSSQASEGDLYATQIYDAIRRNWNVPTGMIDDAALAALVAEIRVTISDDGDLQNARINRSSGNQMFDDACMQAIRATAKVPPPPPEAKAKFRRGLLLEFPGKDLAR